MEIVPDTRNVDLDYSDDIASLRDDSHAAQDVMNHSVAEVTVPVIQLVPCKCNMRLHDWYGGYAGLPLCEECLGIGNRFLYLGYRSSSQANALAFGTLLSGASVPVLKSNCSSY